ncbi:hypothetical protein [Brevundimonas vesicularis]|uniref:hypothetical protein n=1 Tax=Brevundimonas vesicularis TaxID=41276 RepID=UPI0022AC882F|nr:hypothetical protein [Brevundimonas vesicularis]
MTHNPTDALRLVPSMPTVELSDDMLFKIETGETVTWGELKRRQYEQAVRNFNTMREDGSLPAPASPLPGGGMRAERIAELPDFLIALFDEWGEEDHAEAAKQIVTFLTDSEGLERYRESYGLPAAPTGEQK